MRVRVGFALPVAAALLVGTGTPAVAEVIEGTNGSDVLYGTAARDLVHGYKGADVVYAQHGNDTVWAGPGADEVPGRAGDDARQDVLYGGPGADRISARTVDVVFAGDGDDTVRVLEVEAWKAYPEVHCGPGEGTLVLPYGVDYGPHPDCEHVRSAPSPVD